MLDRATFLRPIAHRGLHDQSRGVIENTGPAFDAAIAAGYGIECDLRPAAGGLPVVFHDDTLDRLVDGKGPVAALTADDLAGLKHRVGGAPILTFAEFLTRIAGRVPLIVEIKSEWDPPDTAFLSRIAALAADYKGPLALISFDPDVMAVVRRLAPNIPRGIVSGSYKGKGWWGDRLSVERKAGLSQLAELVPVEPDFYAYQVDALPTPATERARHETHLPLFAWTVRTEAQRQIAAQWADAMIFEGFRP